MKLSTTMYTYLKKLPFEETAKILSTAGFQAIDFPLQLEKSYPAKEEYFKEIKSIADDYGLQFNQTHAPFKPNVLCDNMIENKFHRIINVMKFTSILGAPIIVVHPLQHLPHDEKAEELFDLNMSFFEKLIPYAQEYGLKIALENSYQRNARNEIGTSVCGSPGEYLRYLNGINSDSVVACLDIGHAILCKEDPAMFIKKLGDKLQALHIHENDGKDDLHLLPYACGTTDWDSISQALKDVGYKGDLTFEAVNYLEKHTPDLLQSATMIMASVGEHLKSKIIC